MSFAAVNNDRKCTAHRNGYNSIIFGQHSAKVFGILGYLHTYESPLKNYSLTFNDRPNIKSHKTMAQQT